MDAIARFGSPLYLYDEAFLRKRCREVAAMPHAFGLQVGYAMKANSNRALLQIVKSEGLGIDASSFNEAKRALLAGFAWNEVSLTSQEAPEGPLLNELDQWLAKGLRYTACSMRQLGMVAALESVRHHPMAIRVNPGSGAGESVTRNTGDKYSSFGIPVAQLEQATAFARERGIRIATVHVHIGSGGDPAHWRENIDRMLAIVDRYFPEATSLNLGGGFKEARMPGEAGADVEALGRYAEQQFRRFAERTGRKLTLIIEPGTYLVANAGYLVTTVIDLKSTGADGFEFLVLDGGMESLTRPLLYGSRHPFYVISSSGEP